MPPSLREARTRAYRALIVGAAERVFAEHGYDDARVQQIADAADISVGTIYGVFGSKAELYGLVLTHRLDEVTAIAARAAGEGTNIFDRLMRGLNAYITYMVEHPDFLRIHVREHAWGLRPTHTTGKQFEAWERGLALLTSIVEQAVSEGVLVQSDPVLLARSVVAIQQVHLAAWIDGGMEKPTKAVAGEIEKAFEQMFRADSRENAA